MNELRQSAIILSLIEHLRSHGSWCGETHVQKATYFLKELLRVPLSFDFILYKYGPYSFELSDDLVAMRADSLIRLVSNYPYGPSLAPGEACEQIKKQFPRTLAEFEVQISFVSDKLAHKTISELEALSTALYVRLNEGTNLSTNRHLELLRQFKPHIKPEVALDAVKELGAMITEWSKLQRPQGANVSR